MSCRQPSLPRSSTDPRELTTTTPPRPATRPPASIRTSRPAASRHCSPWRAARSSSRRPPARAARTTTGPASTLPAVGSLGRRSAGCSPDAGRAPQSGAARFHFATSARSSRRATRPVLVRRGCQAAGSLRRCALSARALRARSRGRRDRAVGAPLQPISAPSRSARIARRGPGRGGARRSGARRRSGRACRDHGDVLARAVQVRRPRLSVRAPRGRSRRPERRPRGRRSRAACAACRRVLRPAARRARSGPTGSTKRVSTRFCSGGRG